MIPTNSSNSTNGCDSISSNCVIWQGPDISCINLCNGDTISDVTAKLAELVCNLIEEGVASNPNLTGLDISCLNVPGVTPTTLVPVLQAMVNAICAENSPAEPTAGYIQANLPIMTLPACLVYNDSSGNPVTQLRLDLFTTLIANKVCDILTAIVTINATLSNYNTRISVLEACVLPCTGASAETQVVPTCIINVGVLTPVSVLLLALEVRFCALETAVGLPAAINLAISQGSCILSTTTTLADHSVSYGSIPGWNNTPVNLAQTTQNIWAVLCDMYAAVSSIQINCCPSGCASVSFGYNTSNILASNGTISGLNFNFQNTIGNGSVIPVGFNDCAGSTIISITDVNNVTVTSTVSVTSLQNSAGGVTISVPSLNTYGPLTTSIAFCVTNGNDTCNDTIVKSVAGIIPCPMPVVSLITSSGATVTFTNGLGIAPVYIIDIIDVVTNVITETYTQNSPSTTVIHAFTSLAIDTLYEVRVTIQVAGQTKVCTSNIITFTTTLNPDAQCLIDYGFDTPNLNVTEYRDGTLLVDGSLLSNTAFSNLKVGAWRYPDGNSANAPIYGRLYNWYAVAGIYDTASWNDASLRKVLPPINYQVPNKAHWDDFINCLGGFNYPSTAGAKMKEVGTAHWAAAGGTNTSGFTALGAGYVDSSGVYQDFTGRAYWWASDSFQSPPENNAYSFSVYFNLVTPSSAGTANQQAFSVRVIPDYP
jgi:uncharacterized protein (TIGR02145 family)